MGRVLEVVAAKPLHRVAREEIAFGVLRARRKAGVLGLVGEIARRLGDGIDQQLSRKRDAGIAAGDRGGGCEIAAGAVAGDSDAAFSPPNWWMRPMTSRVAAKASSNAPGKRVSGGRR